MPSHEPTGPGHGMPDPASSYERAKPEKEAGQGRLDNDVATPHEQPDLMSQAVKNRQPPRQVNAEPVTDERAGQRPGAPSKKGNEADPAHLPPPAPVDHSMHEEEPDGWDLAPQDIRDKRARRHSRTEGKGGTP